MSEGSITRLLHEVEAGAPGAEDRLFERVYIEMQRIAAARMAGERRHAADGQSDDLVHEAYQLLAGEDFENRRHLFSVYARTMRQILVDRARRNGARKRGGGWRRVSLEDLSKQASGAGAVIDELEAAELLEKLKAAAPRQGEVFEMAHFGGLSSADIAVVLGVSERTVRTELSSARQTLAAWARDRED